VRRVTTIAEVRAAVRAARAEGRRVGFVPTMGWLHEGHLSLVDRAKARDAWVVLSVYVNPLQFGPAEDFERYPRDLERDARLAEARGVDCLFAPTDREIYPDFPARPAVTVVPRALADRLCGLARPGHFEGVLTVVAKLFHIVQPDFAVFGQKDYQQAVLVRRMVRDLDWPIEIDVAPTVREPDGLAMSSRNEYLSPEERVRARALSRGLAAAVRAFRAGERDAARLRETARAVLAAEPGVEVEYVELVDPETLDPVGRASERDVLAVAARVGPARLIDNVILGAPDPQLAERVVRSD
jgi:pantoate--beta-alanine ligase